jgi:hypothetical protein
VGKNNIKKFINFAIQFFSMKALKIISFLFLITFFSCKNDDVTRITDNIKDAKKKQIIFKNIDSSWTFLDNSLSPEVQTVVSKWKEWDAFIKELKQKPKSTIGAFQKKSKILSTKALDLSNNIPDKFSKPVIKSRLAVLLTQFRSLELYINLQNIPDKKVTALIPEINAALGSLEMQFEEIIRKEHIPMEQGESDVRKMMDTTRAARAAEPEQPTDVNFPKI